MENIKGKVVVITGASSELGEATARLLSAEGATVVLDARRVDRIQSLADELNARGGQTLAVATDVTDHIRQPLLKHGTRSMPLPGHRLASWPTATMMEALIQC